jgi:hypothetical protein
MSTKMMPLTKISTAAAMGNHVTNYKRNKAKIKVSIKENSNMEAVEEDHKKR